MYFDQDNNLVIKEEPLADRGSINKWYISARVCDMVYWNLKAGKEWDMSCPIIEITREQAAFILTEYKPRRSYGT